MSMLVRIFFMITIVLAIIQNCFSQYSDIGELKINIDNPHYFTYKNKPTVLITHGHSMNLASSDYYKKIGEKKLNHKTIVLMTAKNRAGNPYKNENLKQGWNEEVWSSLKENVKWANDYDIVIGIQIWGSPMIEQGEKRWDTHLWNEKNGGPIPDQGSSKDMFYTLYDYEKEITGSYDLDWSWQKQNQFRQEELVKKYLTELIEFPNVYFIPMYEVGDHWGSSIEKIHQWHEHINWLIKKYQPNRLTASVLGTISKDFLGDWSDIDFLLFEGPGLAYEEACKDIWNVYNVFNKPLVWNFLYTPSSINPDTDDKNPQEKMRNSLIWGLHPATKFGAGFSLDDYANTLADFIGTVENWCDEPGQEITEHTVPQNIYESGVDLSGGNCEDSNINTNRTKDIIPPSPPRSIKIKIGK